MAMRTWLNALEVLVGAKLLSIYPALPNIIAIANIIVYTNGYKSRCLGVSMVMALHKVRGISII